MNDIPQIGKKYNCFDDGEIKPSRLYTVVIEKIIPFNKIDDKTLEEWKQEVKDCYWLYNTETDYFIKASDSNGNILIFCQNYKK